MEARKTIAVIPVSGITQRIALSNDDKMVFTADNKMTREPVAKAGAKGEGTWRLSPDGFCSTWKGAKENCFRVQASGDKKWAVIAGTSAVAYWTK